MGRREEEGGRKVWRRREEVVVGGADNWLAVCSSSHSGRVRPFTLVVPPSLCTAAPPFSDSSVLKPRGWTHTSISGHRCRLPLWLGPQKKHEDTGHLLPQASPLPLLMSRCGLKPGRQKATRALWLQWASQTGSVLNAKSKPSAMITLCGRHGLVL